MVRFLKSGLSVGEAHCLGEGSAAGEGGRRTDNVIALAFNHFAIHVAFAVWSNATE
jgi:hypothetical protein